jgi:hypothetical protein
MLNRILYWTPRIICILAILFMSMFALDSFSPGIPFGKQVAAFLIHLIPSFILTGLLVFTWKYELAGGLIFTLTGLGIIIIYAINGLRSETVSFARMLSYGLILFSPFVVAGILFIIRALRLRKNKVS